MLLQDLFQSGEQVVTALPGDTIRQAVALMKGRNVGAVVVTKGKKVAGIVTDRDIALATGLGEATPETPLEGIMHKEVKSIWADQGVFNACQALAGYKLRRLPVIDRDENLVGLVAADDLVALLARELFNASKAIEPSLKVKM
jgi:CBS domain-containing protein